MTGAADAELKNSIGPSGALEGGEREDAELK